jgi:hypothetical protein
MHDEAPSSEPRVSTPGSSLRVGVEAIADQDEPSSQQHQRRAWEKGHPPLAQHDLGAALTDHDSPFGRRPSR